MLEESFNFFFFFFLFACNNPSRAVDDGFEELIMFVCIDFKRGNAEIWGMDHFFYLIKT